MTAIFLESVKTVYLRKFQDVLADVLNKMSISIFGIDVSLYLIIGLLLLIVYFWNERRVLSRIVQKNPYLYGVMTFFYDTTEADHFSVRLKEISSNHRFPLNFQTPLFNRSIVIHKETLHQFSIVTEPFRMNLKQAWKNRKKPVKYARRFSQLANSLYDDLSKLQDADISDEKNYKEYVFKLATFTVMADTMENEKDIHTFISFPNQTVIDELYLSEDLPIIRFILFRLYFNDKGETPYFYSDHSVCLIYPTGKITGQGTFAMCVMNKSIQHSHDEAEQVRKVRRMLWILKVTAFFKELINKGKEEISNWFK